MTKTFGKILEEARKRKKMTGSEAAKEFGIIQSQYSKYESGKIKKFPIEFLAKVCVLFELDANEVIGLKPPDSVDTNITVERVLNKNKQASLFNQLQICIDKSKELQNNIVNEQLSKIKLTSSQITIWHDNEIGYTISVWETNRFTSLCCMLTVFILEMLKQIARVAEINGGVDENMAQVYILWKNMLMLDILSK